MLELSNSMKMESPPKYKTNRVETAQSREILLPTTYFQTGCESEVLQTHLMSFSITS